MKSLSVSEARENLPRLADEVARTGEPVIIERRGRALVMIVPVEAHDLASARMSLRGVPVRVAPDFDESADDLWEAAKP